MADPEGKEASRDADGEETAQLRARILSSVGAVHRKMRTHAAILTVFRQARWVLIGLSALGVLARLELVPMQVLLGATLTSFLVVVGTAFIHSREPSPLSAALRIDRHFGFEGRFAAAYEFSNRAAAPNRGFARLVLAEAQPLFPFAPGQAYSISIPRSSVGVVALVGLFGLVVLVPLPAPPSRPTSVAETTLPPQTALLGDDAELVKERAQELVDKIQSEEGKRFASEFNQLVIQLTDGSLTRSEGFKEAAAIEALIDQTSQETEALARGLAKRGEVLKKSGTTKGAGEALSERRYLDAQEALEKLAERLQAGTEGLSKQELDELRASLEQLRKERENEARGDETSVEQNGSRASLKKERDALEEKKKRGSASPEDWDRLAEAERQLKRLDRQRKQASAAAQQLSELDRQLAEAAKALAEERKKSGDFLKEAARQVGQAAARKLTDEEKKELLKQLEALKERLRQRRQEGAQQERMRDFQRRARGEQDQSGEPGSDGSKGQPGSMQSQVTLGPSGAPLPGSGDQEPQDASRSEAAGQEAGHGHDEQLVGESSRLDNRDYDDKSAVGQDSGQGPSASETIASAAERGFVSGSYEKLYHEYETVAEEVMEKDRIPPGRKSHVRRYFELIRPRDTN